MERSNSYRLLDSGAGRRLERFGAYLTDRPAPVAIWPQGLSRQQWQEADSFFDEKKGWSREFPADWSVTIDGITFGLRLSPGGQIGVFPEQLENWHWIRKIVGASKEPVRALNLFAYTGGSTLAAAAGEVCHVDAAKASIRQAKRNAQLSGLSDRPFRWLLDDVPKFVARELKRGSKYDLIILDPPAFGHGPKGEQWKLTRDLPGLLDAAHKLLSERATGFLFSCHVPEWTKESLTRMFEERGLAVEALSLYIPAGKGGNDLPAGLTARWQRR